MEDVLTVYHLPYDHDYPVVCMDESSKQLVGEVHTPIPCKPGQAKRIDDEYVRHGVAEIFMEVEPLAGKRHVAITERRTRKDWAGQIKQMLDERCQGAIKVHLVMDNLNTHNIASLYETYMSRMRLNGWRTNGVAYFPDWSLSSRALFEQYVRTVFSMC